MKVTLAVEYNDGKKTHQPDATVELDDRVARSLISKGRARIPEKASASAPAEKKES